MAKPTLNYYQTMQVAKVKTDVVQFTTITEAIAAITARGAPATGKRWAVYVHPGTYTEQVVMVDWVDVIAIGGREETVISFVSTADDDVTVTGRNAMLKGFTIVSDGTAATWRTRCVSNAIDGFEMVDCVLAPTGPAAAAVTFIATASCEIRDCQVDTAAAAATAVSLDTNTEEYTIYETLLGGATTSLLVTDCLTLVMSGSTLTNLLDHDACATSTIISDSILEEIDLDGGTLFEMRQTYVETIAADTGGTVIAYGGTIRACSSVVTASFVWWENDESLRVLPNMLIANAITAGAAVASATQNVTIHLEAATYTETGLTLADDVNIVGVSHDDTIITSASGATIVTTAAAVVCTLKDLQISETNSGVCLTVTGAGADVLCDHCEFFSDTDALTAVNGALTLHQTIVRDGDIELSTATVTLIMEGSQILGGNLNSAADGSAHVIRLIYVDFNGNNIDLNHTGAATTELRYCTDIATFAEDTLVGTVTIENTVITTSATKNGTSPWSVLLARIVAVANNNITGGILIYGGYVHSCTAVTGSVVWQHDTETEFMVITGMLIEHALAVAVAGDTVKLGQGTFAENNLAPATGVDIIGEGQEVSLIVDTSANPIFAIGNNVSVTIRRVQVSNPGTGGAITVSPVANASALVLEDCDVVNAGASDCVTVSIGGAGSGTLTARRCDFTSDALNSIVVLAQTAGVGLLYFTSDLCSFTTSGGAANAAIEASSANVVDVNVKRATFSGCTLAVYSTGDNHTVDIDESDFINAGVELAGNVPVVQLQECYGIGAFAHSVACTVTLLDCQFTDTYTIGAVAGIVNASRTQFATFTNGGSGAIAFQGCFGTDINNNDTSTMTIEGGNWDTVLQAAAAGTIDIYEATVATELDCGAGGAINAYNCEVTDVDSNGGTITLYGGVLVAVSDATGVIIWWEAPHRLRVIASTANMSIMDAADAATAGDTILIGPGTFDEALDLDAAGNVCTYKGFGRDKTIIYQDGANVVLVDGMGTAALPVVFEDLTIELDNGDDEYALKVNAVTTDAAVTLRNVSIDADWAANTVHGLLAADDATQIATVEAYNCEIACTGGANSYAVAADDCDTVASSVIRLYNTILNGQTYDVYDDQILIELHQCELNGAGVWVADSITAEVVAFNKEPFATATPVTFAGAANGVFADLGGCELWTCVATVDLYEWVYVSAGDTILEADADGVDTHPSIGMVVWKPGGDAGLTAYVKKHGYIYKPAGGWTAGAIQYLDTTAGQDTETRPDDAVIEILGVAKNAQCMLANVVLTDAGLAGATKWLNIPIAFGAGSAPTGTHVDGNSRRAVAIAVAGQTVFSQMVAIPKDFQAFAKLVVTVFGTTTGSFDWTAWSSAASDGEDEAAHSDTATADTQGVTDDEILDHDISAAADGYTMVQDDKFSCELLVDVLTTTTQLLVLGFKMEYIPTK